MLTTRAACTPERVINRFGFTKFAFNWKEDEDLVEQLEDCIREARDRNMLDPVLFQLYANGTETQKRVLADMESYQAAAIALLRPKVFQLLGQYAPLLHEDPEKLDTFVGELRAEAKMVEDDVLGSTVSEMGAFADTRSSFAGQTIPVTRASRW